MTPNNYPEGLDELAVSAASSCDLFGTKQPPDVAAKQNARALLDALAERGYVLVDAKKQEPACYLDLEKMTPSGMVYATGFRVNSKQSPLYTHPAIPGRVALPEGWKLVPAEPTDAMIKASFGCFGVTSPGPNGERKHMAIAYHAMLSAAPTPPTQPQGDGSLRME